MELESWSKNTLEDSFVKLDFSSNKLRLPRQNQTDLILNFQEKKSSKPLINSLSISLFYFNCLVKL